MYNFDYHQPSSVSAAAALLTSKAQGKLLAGGQSLVQSMKQRLMQPSDVIDLGKIAELRGIKVSADAITVGAMTTHAEVANSAEIKKALPALAHLAGEIGDRQVRALGTLGGALANSDPAADYPAAVLGLGASIQTNKRSIAADQFFKGLFETALQADEIILSATFPLVKRAGYAKFKHPASRFALVGVFVSQSPAGTRVAVTGAGPCVFRLAQMEQALASNFTPGALAGLGVPSTGLNSDMHAASDYRAHLIAVMAKRAVQEAALS